MYKRVCLCVLVHVNKTVYLLPMKGVFAWTNPQLIFLFELLQAHCTNLKEIGGVRRCFLYKAMHHFSFVLVKRTNTHTKKTKNFYQQHQKLNKNPPQNSLKKNPKPRKKVQLTNYACCITLMQLSWGLVPFAAKRPHITVVLVFPFSTGKQSTL